MVSSYLDPINLITDNIYKAISKDNKFIHIFKFNYYKAETRECYYKEYISKYDGKIKFNCRYVIDLSRIYVSDFFITEASASDKKSLELSICYGHLMEIEKEVEIKIW